MKDSQFGEVGTYVGNATPPQAAPNDASVGLLVSVAPASPSICLGQCVDLTATVRSGVAPYQYEWSGVGGIMGGTLRVCPSTTTTYQVTATDSTGHAGELAASSAQSSASVTVAVGSVCAAAPDASAPEAGSPQTQLPTALEVCSTRWSAPIGFAARAGDPVVYAAPPLVASDRAGNIVVAATYASAATSGALNGEILKFDGQCRPLWRKEFVAQDPVGPGSVSIEDLSVDASSSIVFVGRLFGSVDFGAGTLSTGGAGEPFVVKLDTNGMGLWSKAFASYTVDLTHGTVDLAGNVIVSGEGLAGADFGGGPLGIPSTQPTTYVVEFGSDGSYRAALAVAALPLYFAVATTAGTGIVLAGIQQNATTWPGGAATVDDAVPIVARYDPFATYAWSTSVATRLFSSRESYLPSVRVRVGASKAIHLMYGTDGPPRGVDGGTLPSTRARGVAKLSPTGQALWVDESDFVDESPSPPFEVGISNGHLFALDANEHPIAGGDVQQAATDWDVYLRRIGDTGHVIQAARWGTTGPDHLMAIDTDTAGHTLIVGVQAAAPTVAAQTMFLAKLAF